MVKNLNVCLLCILTHRQHNNDITHFFARLSDVITTLCVRISSRLNIFQFSWWELEFNAD